MSNDRTRPVALNTVTLGMTDLEVSPIAFGAWQLGGEWGQVDEDAAIAAIRHARELGVNLFDTAQGYGFGASERLLGRALRDDLDTRRDEVVIATKGGLRMTDSGLVRDSSPAWLRSGVESSLRALGVDHIDIYQVHWPDPDVPFAETAGALQELVDEGKICHVGVSNFDAAQMSEFAQTRPVETLQPPYDLFRRDIEAEVLPYSRGQDIGVLIYGPLAHGLLTGALDENTTFAPGDWRGGAPFFKGEDFRRNVQVVRELERFAGEQLGVTVSRLAIAWTLANPAVHVAIVGARSPEHIEDSIRAGELSLSAADLEQIDSIMAGAVSMSGPHPEMMPE
ncbi:MAG TPA: aldo/keto reductase [Thermoleophilaceae bacterium]|nr:aldo/keto reductase [Thermoleophilaceae bacterium]